MDITWNRGEIIKLPVGHNRVATMALNTPKSTAIEALTGVRLRTTQWMMQHSKDASEAAILTPLPKSGRLPQATENLCTHFQTGSVRACQPCEVGYKFGVLERIKMIYIVSYGETVLDLKQFKHGTAFRNKLCSKSEGPQMFLLTSHYESHSAPHPKLTISNAHKDSPAPFILHNSVNKQLQYIISDLCSSNRSKNSDRTM
ncbi:hypothetical protein E2C01_005560 [Portunus trituberculatus]|uniref:Uncharacterized protein n=1 Tax=Portunus trituberculatus TaxID=210409 RepID=A0A5B7CVU2_PORTR|nr:hypothetical protein [Portunus trituberculatus]